MFGKMKVKFLSLIFCGLLAGPVSAQTNQTWRTCRNPVRVFGGSPVNLAPLFQWWERQPQPGKDTPYTNTVITVDTNAPETGRPLAAWHRVTGIHAGTLASGAWVVEAVIYTSPTARTNTRIILNHPPALEEQEYLTLKAELEQASEQINNAHKLYEAGIKAAQKDDALVNDYRHSRSKQAPTGINVYSQAEAQQEAAATAAANQQQQLTAARDQIEKQFKAVPALNGHYQIDWFAMLAGCTKTGVPIYDLGLVAATPMERSLPER